jgi:DNA-3-methyladenine glycosylase
MSHPPDPEAIASAGRAPAPGGLPALPATFFARPAEQVAPDLLGCRLVKRLPGGEHLWAVIVETEAYSQDEPACHGFRRRSPSNETLFGQPAHFYVYVSYGIHHCVNVVTGRRDWANGVLLRAAYLPDAPERLAAGPALLSRHFGLDRRQDALPVDPSSGLWLTHRCPVLRQWLESSPMAWREAVVRAGRIGVSAGQDLPLRWYLRGSRSVSRRAAGDRTPRVDRLAGLLEAGPAGRAGGSAYGGDDVEPDR